MQIKNLAQPAAAQLIGVFTLRCKHYKHYIHESSLNLDSDIKMASVYSFSFLTLSRVC